MTIVSEESRELADTLEEREVELLLKVRTISGTEKQNFIIINSILPHFSENRDTKPWLSWDDLIKID